MYHKVEACRCRGGGVATSSFADVLSETNAQTVWNTCLEELKDRIPNYENKNAMLFQHDYVKPVFSNLAALYNGNVGTECRERIANSEEIKKFLSSIKDWSTWDKDKKGYLAGEKYVHEGWNQVRKIRVLSLSHWSDYQKWRFVEYFLKGADTLPASKTDPRGAYVQMNVPLPDDCLVDEDDLGDDGE